MATDGKVESPQAPVCGIIMPISALDGCAASHWADVLEILSEAVEEAGFEPNLVSNAEEVTFIHKTIIQNIYDNPIVVCDVSGKNPNVMFELGMRLAFDKPTIIVKDDKTTYSFDTASIEHLEYPRDLRFPMIVEFKRKLREKIKATHEKTTTDSGYTTFLKHFGQFTVAKLDKKELPSQEYIIGELKAIRMQLNRLQTNVGHPGHSDVSAHPFMPISERLTINPSGNLVDFCLEGLGSPNDIAATVSTWREVDTVTSDDSKGHIHLNMKLRPGITAKEIKNLVRSCSRFIRQREAPIS